MGTRAEKKVVFVRGKRYTILPALTLKEFIAIDIMEGSCTKECFKNFIISDVVIIFLNYILFLWIYIKFYINFDFFIYSCLI